MKFSEKQFDYLSDAAQIAYDKRWQIGKDSMDCLFEFVYALQRAQGEGKSFREYLDSLDKDSPDYPF